MNIVHITLGLRRGGIERLICDLSPIQLRQGHSVRVLCVMHGDELQGELESAGVPVDWCGIRDLRKKQLPWTWWLKGYLRRNDVHAVIEHSGLDGHVAWACGSVGVPHMVSVVHNTYWVRLNLKRMVQHRIYMNYYRCLVAVSESVRRFEMRNYGVPPNRIEVIPNGIVLERFKQDAISLAEKRRLLGGHLSGQEVLVGTVGNLRFQKNHEMLIRAWAKLVSRCPVPTKLIIVGDGVLREQLERLRDGLGLSDSVVFLGSRSDVPELMRCFDVFVMSSRYEGQGIVALEAMASGLPVVATNVSGLRDIVDDGINGFLVDSDNPEVLAPGMQKLVLNAELRRSIGQAGRRIVEQRYSIEKCAEAYEKALLASSLATCDRWSGRVPV